MGLGARYIGKTNNPKNRLYRHIATATNGRYYDDYKSRWLRHLIHAGLRPTLEIIFVVPDGEDWRIHERLHISDAVAAGWPLTNTTKGGEGVEFLSDIDATRAKLARRAGFTEGTRQAMRQKAQLAWSDKENRLKRIAAMTEAASLPERRAQLSIAAHSRSAEGEAKRLQAVRAYWADPANRRKLGEITSQRMRDGLARKMAAKSVAKRRQGKS